MEGTLRKDTIEERLVRYLPNRGFTEVNTNADGMHVFLYRGAEGASVFFMIRDTVLSGMTPEQYRERLEVLRRWTAENGLPECRFLTLFVSADIAKARACGEGSQFWIADETYGRLIIYEDQPEDFLGLRRIIEQNLHFGADIRNESGMQKIGVVSASAPAAVPLRVQRVPSTNVSTARDRIKAVGIVTVMLIAANVIVYLLETRNASLVPAGSNDWDVILNKGEYYRLFTCMFLHGGLDHLFNNMMVLFFVGGMLEQLIGSRWFLFAYLASGLAASVASFGYHMYKEAAAYSIGASGAVYGVLGILVFLVFVNRDRRDTSVLIRLAFFAVYMLIQVVLPSAQNIDHAAHIGGFVMGTVLGALFYFTGIADRRRRVRR